MVRLHEAAHAEFRDAEDTLVTVRRKVAQLAAGVIDPDDQPIDVPAVAAADSGRVAVARKRSPALIAIGALAGGAALAGSVISIGGATPAQHLEATAPAVFTTAVVETVARNGDEPVKVTARSPAADAADPGTTIYAARFARASASERACLARAVYYEARGEGFDGQVAVAQVILNRTRSVKWPGTICGVVNQGIERGEKCQFSFACMAHSEPVGQLWEQAQSVAEQAVTGHAWLREALEATHYHATNVAPVWRIALVATGTIGSHVFYREGNGLRAAAVGKAAPVAVAPQPVKTATAGAPKSVRAKPVGAGAPALKAVVDDANWSTQLFRP